VEEPEYDHVFLGQLVPDLVVSDQNAANLARLELAQADPQTRVSGNPFCPGDELTNDPARRPRVHRPEKLVQADEIGVGLARPAQRHVQRLPARFGLSTPAAQASTSA
jgi:hypothetical protein